MFFSGTNIGRNPRRNRLTQVHLENDLYNGGTLGCNVSQVRRITVWTFFTDGNNSDKSKML